MYCLPLNSQLIFTKSFRLWPQHRRARSHGHWLDHRQHLQYDDYPKMTLPRLTIDSTHYRGLHGRDTFIHTYFRRSLLLGVYARSSA